MTGSRIPTQAGATTACRTCGTVVSTGQAKLAGVWSKVGATSVWDCERCTREHLHEIEAGVDRARW